MKQRTFKKWQKIEFTWIDSCGDTGWSRESAVDDKYILITTVGYFQGNSKECLHVVQSLHAVSNGRYNTDARLQVPWVAIKKIKKL